MLCKYNIRGYVRCTYFHMRGNQSVENSPCVELSVVLLLTYS